MVMMTFQVGDSFFFKFLCFPYLKENQTLQGIPSLISIYQHKKQTPRKNHKLLTSLEKTSGPFVEKNTSQQKIVPICSIYGIFSYIDHKFKPSM